MVVTPADSAVGLEESVAVKATVVLPVLVGVPEIVPCGSSVKPAGSVLAVLQVTGSVPPVPARARLYCCPTVPFEDVGTIVERVGAATEASVTDFEAVAIVGEVESVTVTVNVELPVAEVCPEMMPVEPSRLSPLGSDPEVTDHE